MSDDTTFSAPMEHRIIGLLDTEAWQKTLAQVPHAFGHTLSACRAFTMSTGYESFLLSCKTATFHAICALARRSFMDKDDVFTPPGFSGFAMAGVPTDFAAHWQEIGKKQGWVCAYIQQHPLLGSPFEPPTQDAPIRAAYVLDISHPTSALLARMSQSRRRRLKENVIPGLGISPNLPAVLAFLERQATSFFEARSAEQLAIPTSEGWAEIVTSPDVVSIEVRLDGQIVAVSLFGGTGEIADYLYNISTQAGQRFSAHLIWHAIPVLRELGFCKLNLGGGIRANDSIAEFKRRFGPDELAIVTHRPIFDPVTYHALAEKSHAVSGDPYFPVYHRRG